MRKVLIAMSSDDLCAILKDHLDPMFSVTTCLDGETALQLLKDLRPEVFVIDLSLPVLDGISLLEQAQSFRPPVILAAIDYDSDYVRDKISELGISYIIKLPGNINAIVTRLVDMVDHMDISKPEQNVYDLRVTAFLMELNFATHLKGYRYLQAAICFFAEDTSQQMDKEIYDRIAVEFDATNYKAVEKAIRTAIEKAWAQRFPQVWDQYFLPGSVKKAKGPSNKAFVSRIVEILMQR